MALFQRAHPFLVVCESVQVDSVMRVQGGMVTPILLSCQVFRRPGNGLLLRQPDGEAEARCGGRQNTMEAEARREKHQPPFHRLHIHLYMRKWKEAQLASCGRLVARVKVVDAGDAARVPRGMCVIVQWEARTFSEVHLRLEGLSGEGGPHPRLLKETLLQDVK